MKRFALIFALLCSMLTQGRAQQMSDFSVYASSGYAMPSSPMTFADYWKMQYSGSIGVGYAVAPGATLIAAVDLYQFTLDQAGVRNGFDTRYMRDIWIFDDVSLTPSANPTTLTTVTLNLRMMPLKSTGIVSPFLMAGGGAMRFELSPVSLPTRSTLTLDGTTIPITAERRITGGTETTAYAQLGIGAEFDCGGVIRPYLEARYGIGFTHGIKTTLVPLSAGLRMQL